ncbi:HNH endonuclease [Arthrobacter rhombi]|uniref:HNH endonuclease n=1 Tax=Arthrobacter rhombi TaxID=71253 RepID=UPI003FD28351
MKIKPQPKGNPRRTNGARRDKLRARILREETHCWLCKQPVDTKLPHGQPASPEVDEIIPVSKGGDPFDRRNCRLAHRICNQRRGNKDATQMIVQRMQPLKTSRQWR